MDSVKGVIGKAKNFLGPVGVKMTVALESKELKKADGTCSGTITLVAEQDVLFEHISVRMNEEYTTGRGEDKQTQSINMGEKELVAAYLIKAGETKTIDFSLPYVLSKSRNDRLKEGGKLASALGTVGSFMDAEKSEYKVEVWSNIKGKLMCPGENIEVQLA